MNDNEKEFEKFVREVKFDDTPDPKHRDKLEQNLLRTMTKQPRQKQPLQIWRTIMKSRIRKLVAAVVVIAALIGVYQFGGGRAAFAQTTKAVRITLARLKEFVMEIRTREAAPPPPRRPVPQIDISKWSDIIQYDLFLVQGKQANLQNFFEKQDIEFTPTTNNPNVCYAILEPDKADRFTEFSQSSDELKVLATPRLILKDGKDAILGSADLAGSGGLAFAVAGTLLDDNKHIELSFSLYDGETGIEIPSIRIKTDEAVLIREVKTETEAKGDGSNKENDIFILIRTKVLSPT
ncbi:hypothetical protein ES703_100955 [subsurface metagenome]